MRLIYNFLVFPTCQFPTKKRMKSTFGSPTHPALPTSELCFVAMGRGDASVTSVR